MYEELVHCLKEREKEQTELNKVTEIWHLDQSAIAYSP
jgi:hypothetical protein